MASTAAATTTSTSASTETPQPQPQPQLQTQNLHHQQHRQQQQQQQPNAAYQNPPQPDPRNEHEDQSSNEKHYASILPSERQNQKQDPKPDSKDDSEDAHLNLHHTLSTFSNHHDLPMPPLSYVPTGENDQIYTRFTPHRKMILTAVLSFCSFLAPISSTTVLAAVPEVADTFGCDGSVVNLSNACYMAAMGLSPCFYGPIGTIYGRRWVSIISATLFTAASIGTALAPNLAAFFVFRILTAFQGTAFLIIGSSVIGDVYKPTERGTALGWFLSGTLIGPALGPFIGGIIVTYRSWRDIFWLQTGLAAAATLLVVFFQPETIHQRRADELADMSRGEKYRTLWTWLNPLRIITLYRYPNLLAVAFASSALVWNMYSLLTPIRYVLNPRFALTTPLQSGLFYLAPGAGYLVGTLFGGRWADALVKKYIRIRGERVAEDRLRSCLPFLGGVMPACMLVYGWSVEKRVGGVALPVVMMFVQGVAQLFCFPSLNTYCLDVMQGRSAEVVAGNYAFRYLFAAVGSAVCLPAVRAIGVGAFSSISAGFLVFAAALTYATAEHGRGWRDGVDARREARKEGGGV